MKILVIFFVLGAALLIAACGTTSPQATTDFPIASEVSVLSGRNPVLFVSRAKEDGQWIFLTDERSFGGPVLFASYADIIALDSTLSQVRDLAIGWTATRETKGGPWRRGPNMRGNLAGSSPSSKPFREPIYRASSHYPIQISEPRSKSKASLHWQVTENVLNVWQNEETSEGVVQTLIWSDSLRSAARDSLDTLAARCGLDTLKENYAASEAPSAQRLIFVIGQSKTGHSVVTRLNDCWIPPLYSLTAFVNTLLPKRYAISLDMTHENLPHAD